MEVLVVFTGESVKACLEVGGTQSWVLNRRHAKQCRYAVLCQNAYSKWGDGKEPHGTGFMIGRIADVIRSKDPPDRWLVTFDEYAMINVPNLCKGWRNPVKYSTFEELGISLDGVKFQPMPEATATEAAPAAHLFERVMPSASVSLTIPEAKKALAATYGVKPEAVEITIRG